MAFQAGTTLHETSYQGFAYTQPSHYAPMYDYTTGMLFTPTHFQTVPEGIHPDSKKIPKKKPRNQYQKIDDEVRLNILEEFKQGETLKSIAKRYDVNYSSAKSILHTFRKEGRILRKTRQDRQRKPKQQKTPMQKTSSPPRQTFRGCFYDYHSGSHQEPVQTTNDVTIQEIESENQPSLEVVPFQPHYYHHQTPFSYPQQPPPPQHVYNPHTFGQQLQPIMRYPPLETKDIYRFF